MSIERSIINKLNESRNLKEAEMSSSLQKDVMRAVNDKAPSAMSWRKGHRIKNTKTGKVAEFLGYKKNSINNMYSAYMKSGSEDIRYSLEELQDDIKSGILINMSTK